MIRMRRTLTLVMAMALLTALAPAARSADGTDALPTTVLEVRVRGNKRISERAILARVNTRAGQVYDEQVAKDDRARLEQTRQFRNVAVVKAQTDRGIVVTFVVAERQVLSRISFQGNKSYSDKLLRKELPFADVDPIDPGLIAAGQRALEAYYRKKGFHLVRVTVDEQALEENREVTYRIIEGPRVRVDHVKFLYDDHKTFGDLKLRGKLKTRQAFLFLSRGKLDLDLLAQDVATLQSFFRAEGFLDVEVASSLVFSPDKEHVTVQFLIHEGDRYRVGEVRFENNRVFADRELATRIEMEPGKYFTALGLQRDTERLEGAYGEIGYVETSIASRMVYLEPRFQGDARVALVYGVTEGEQFHLGRVTIRGNDVTKDRVIRRQMTMYPGQLYNSVAQARSKLQLQESRLFDGVEITPYGEGPDVRNALVTVEEGRTAEFIVGFGFSTNSGPVGTASFTQRNFSWTEWPESWAEVWRAQGWKGDGQVFALNLEAGSEILRGRVDWREPYLFDLPVSFGTGLYLFGRVRETYDEERLGAQLSLGKQFPNRWYAELSSRFERVDVSDLGRNAPPDVIEVKGYSELLGFKGTLVRDRTDSRWRPSEGNRFRTGYEQVMGDYTFGKADAEFTQYWTLYLDALDRKHVLAARVSAETIVGDAPVFERFYAGGLGSVRGFRYRGISPRQLVARVASNGNPEIDPKTGARKFEPQVVGGEAAAFAGAEYSFPLVGENLRGVMFVDSGTAERDWDIGTWRVSAGFGIRLYLPFFGPVPMSLDFGFPIVEDPFDENELISFAFGWVF